MKLPSITAFRLVTRNPERLVAFYRALGFAVVETVPIDPGEMAVLGLAGAGLRTRLMLGESRLDLDTFDRPGDLYPADADAADLVFQHLALVTSDVQTAWGKILAAGAMPISRGGPITLPASAGGVTAIKFRDPDGHPLELLQFPAGADTPWQGDGMMGIDHSAVSIATVETSIGFYAAHGLREGHRTLNRGPTQIALDGLGDVVVDVVPMKPATRTPHVELLRYRTPAGRSHPPLAVDDVAATRIVWAAHEDALLRDPDGHLHQLRR